MAKEQEPLESPLVKAERLFIPTTSGSLMESIRGDLPDDDDAPVQLVSLVVKQPSLYSYFIGKLASGASFKAAALTIGVAPSRFTYWLQRGSADIGDDVDSYCSRLLMDVQRAVAFAVGDAEERVYRQNPAQWLTKGPAKDFHQGRYWKDFVRESPEEAMEEANENPIDPIPLREQDRLEEQDDTTVEDDLRDAVKALENHGIITKPEFVIQAKEQYRIDPDGKN